MTNLTNKEMAALTYLASVTDFGEDDFNFCDAIPQDVAEKCGWDMQATGGVLSSLEKKGFISMGELEVYNPYPQTITEIVVAESVEELLA